MIVNKLHTKPSADGFYMPAEYSEQKGCLMIWPERPGSWNYGAANARVAFAKIANEIAESEEVYMLVSEKEYQGACEILGIAGKFSRQGAYEMTGNNDRIHLIVADTDDAWARDTGATFVINGDERRAIDWQFNAWGGEYDGLYAHWDKDQEVAEIIANAIGDKIYDARHFVLEGGSIHVDGEGTLLTTEECLLSPGRNPHMSKEEIEQELKDYLGVKKIIWLPEGIYNDETNGHVDNFCCFTAPGEVLLAWTDDENDPQYERSAKALEILEHETDAQGRKMKITKLPIPAKPICITEEDLQGYEFEEGEDFREVGERLAASYVNFYIANDSVLVPQFGDTNDLVALEIIGKCFPTRRVVGIEARDILTGGGNIHCITQQIPRV